jgi:transcriptional regulatory protein LevR
VQFLQNFINKTKFSSIKGIDIILSYLLKENKEKYPAMYHVAVQVLRNCSETLNYPIKMVCRMMFVVYLVVFQI